MRLSSVINDVRHIAYSTGLWCHLAWINMYLHEIVDFCMYGDATCLPGFNSSWPSLETWLIVLVAFDFHLGQQLRQFVYGCPPSRMLMLYHFF